MNKKAFIPISALMGALLLALVAAMTPFVAEPDRAYAQAASADADLQSLTVAGSPDDAGTGDVLSPTYVATTTMYTARIPNVDSGIDILATAKSGLTGGDQTIKVNGTTVTSGTAHTVRNVAAGTVSTINIEVTAPAGNKKVFTVKVYRERSPKRTDANLSSLGLTGVSLMPAFSSATTSYKARVKAAEVTVSYTLSDPAGGAHAGITSSGSGAVDGMKVPLEDEAARDAATGGITTITVMVTPESVDVDASNTCDTAGIKCYMIEVYRIRSNESTNADLGTNGLTLQTVADTPADVTLTPAYAANVRNYKARVLNATAQVTVAATKADAGAHYTITPSDADRNLDGHQVSLTAGGERTITVRVTAEDPDSTKTYTVKVYRNRSTLSEEARLSSLSLSNGTLDPSFSRATLKYDVRVGPDVDKVTVSYATVDTAGAAIVAVTAFEVDESDNSDGSAITLDDAKPNDIPLQAAGMATRIKVTVTPEAGETDPDDSNVNIQKVYEITIYRVRTAPSADATLSSLTVTGDSALTLAPPFTDQTTTARMFNATVANNISSVTVAAGAYRSARGATVDIDPASPVDLTAGEKTTITITVTAEDGSTTQEYTVDVYRQRETLETDATLSALSLSDGMLDPAFMSDRMEYDVRVGSDVEKVTVTAAPTDDKGGVMVAVVDEAVASDAATCPADEGDEVTLGSPGSETTISVCVTPEAGAGTAGANLKTYEITVYRENRNLKIDNTLSVFRIIDANPSGETYAGDLAPTATVDHDNDTGTAERNYWNLLGEDNEERNVAYLVRTVIVSATPTDSAGGAVARITAPPDKDSTTAAHEIDLTAGAETMITVEVMAEDPNAPTRTYTAKVYRQGLALDDDATLSSLMLSGVDLMYMDDDDMEMTGFMSDVMEYTADAPYSTMQTTVTAMATELGAQNGITITPPDANMAMDGHQVSLTAGQAVTITVQVRPESVASTAVTAANDCTVAAASRHADIECYTVEVTRAAAASDNAKLKSLTLMHGGEEVSLLTAKYWWNTLDCPQMQAVVGDGDMEGDMATYCVMYDDLSAAGKMRVDEVFDMSVEDAWNMIGCELMKQAVKMDDQAFCKMYDGLGDSEMDTVYEVYRPTSFSVMVGGGVDMTNIMAEPAHAGAMVSGDTGMQNLMVGENDFTVTVTAEDEETMMAYMVKVTRAALTDEARLLAMYDRNVVDGSIDLTEVNAAIDDFFDGVITLDEVNIVIDLFFM